MFEHSDMFDEGRKTFFGFAIGFLIALAIGAISVLFFEPECGVIVDLYHNARYHAPIRSEDGNIHDLSVREAEDYYDLEIGDRVCGSYVWGTLWLTDGGDDGTP